MSRSLAHRASHLLSTGSTYGPTHSNQRVEIKHPSSHHEIEQIHQSARDSRDVMREGGNRRVRGEVTVSVLPFRSLTKKDTLFDPLPWFLNCKRPHSRPRSLCLRGVVRSLCLNLHLTHNQTRQDNTGRQPLRSCRPSHQQRRLRTRSQTLLVVVVVVLARSFTLWVSVQPPARVHLIMGAMSLWL